MIVPADSAVLLYAPAAALDPVRFDGPEATVDIKVRGHDLFVQPVLGNTSCEITYLGYVDDRSHAVEDLAAGLASRNGKARPGGQDGLLTDCF